MHFSYNFTLLQPRRKLYFFLHTIHFNMVYLNNNNAGVAALLRILIASSDKKQKKKPCAPKCMTEQLQHGGSKLFGNSDNKHGSETGYSNKHALRQLFDVTEIFCTQRRTGNRTR